MRYPPNLEVRSQRGSHSATHGALTTPTSRSRSGLGAAARTWAVWHSRQPGRMDSGVSFSVYGRQFAPWPGPFEVTPGLCQHHVVLGLEAEGRPRRPRDLGTQGSETGTRPRQAGDEPAGTAQMHPSRPLQKGLLQDLPLQKGRTLRRTLSKGGHTGTDLSRRATLQKVGAPG